MGGKNKKETKMDTKDSYKKDFEYIEKPHLRETYNPEDSLSFINPLNDVPESRLLNFIFVRSKIFEFFTKEKEISQMLRPDIVTVNKITILRNKNTLQIMKNYIDKCYTYNTTESEKQYTSCVMNKSPQLLAFQITECDNTCILSMAFDNQEVYYNYYNKGEFMNQFFNSSFFNKYSHTEKLLDKIKKAA